MGIFGRLAFDDGVTIGTLLATRFVLAAVLFWAIVVATGRLRRVQRRDVLIALALGGVGYSAQAGAYFAALQRIDPGLLSILLYTFPTMVTVAAIALGRERFSGRRAVALVIASSGLVLVVAGAGAGAIEPAGAALGLSAAAIYSTYILSSQGIAGRLDPFLLSALVCTGAAITLTAVGAVDGDLHAVSPGGALWLGAIAVVCTVVAITLFFAGLSRIGPTRASIISTAEPVTAVVLAFAIFGETMTLLQLAGAALVIAGVLRVADPGRRRAQLSSSANVTSTAAPTSCSPGSTGSTSVLRADAMMPALRIRGPEKSEPASASLTSRPSLAPTPSANARALRCPSAEA
jgi:drug/metabolite transporter (DMT)-like permease